MKPIQLKMTAFGPYKFTETIDFSELKGNRLFVISGATGAGKTTIFDGICFALYGYGSGEDRRDTKMMRSDFAADETHTSVELTFEIHGRVYRILRQLPHVKKGNKSATGERYEFFERKGSGEVPVVERQIVSEINKKIEDIIGLSLDQFSQIVMLPQGEFRKLLTSQTENKEAILRKIFKTEPYKMISERLKDKKLLAEAELTKEESTRNSYTEQIVASFPMRDSSVFQLIGSGNFNLFHLIDALKEETAFYSAKIQEDELAYRKAYAKHSDKQAAYHEAKAVNARFIELEEKSERLKTLQEQSVEYEQKQRQLEAAERASSIEPIEVYYSELKAEAHTKLQLLEVSKKGVLLTEEAAKRVENTYTSEDAKKEEREKSVEALIQLNALLPLFEELEVKRIEVLDLEKQATELADQVRLKVNLFAAEKESHNAQKEKIEQLEQLVEPLDEKVQQLTLLQAQFNGLQEYLANEKQLNAFQIEETKQEQIFQVMLEAYRLEERKWMSNQASILASQLLSGEACPVCGSTEHQLTGVDMHEQAIDEEELKQLKEQLNKQESSSLTIQAKKEAAEENGQKLTAKLDELHVSLIEANQLKESVENLQVEIKNLRVEKEKLNSQKEIYKNNFLKLEKLEQEKVKMETIYLQQKSQLEQVKAVYESKQTAIPAHIPTLNELKSQISMATGHKEQLENDWNIAQKQLQLATEAFTKAQLALEHAVMAEKETSEKCNKAYMQLNEALAKSSFGSIEVYVKAKLSEGDRFTLKEWCTSYKQTLHTLTEQVREGKAQLADNERVELAPMEDALVQLKEAYERALNMLNGSKDYEQAGLKLEEKITSTSDRITILEQRVHQIIDLYDVLRGQNQQKISFERYIQMEYLEQIVQAANERLKHMSNGQFQLIRSERQETHGKQSGLGLDVYDAYTGQTRDVKTLSGGEKFNASLCLALGMADVIQSFQGSIRIDTMFIDEGFGSLDEESLNKAIDTLVDLQKSGRMIGVISHVAELKAAMPAILEVEKQKEGYSKTRFVVK
ncbi:SMC family ATPase [Psychrobacillus sp.]|uniref:SMC family ATPase n=1 Tax=Psychrobacillus sp. TaxID=1871623 RepID=UPI0028BD8D8A|nr:SMC family ATPase [Psychrobacillus sp.]